MLTFREFDYSDTDYAILMAIHEAVLPDDPVDEEHLRKKDEIRPKHHYFNVIIAELDDTPVGIGRFNEAHWTTLPDQYALMWQTLPDYRKQGIASAFYAYALERISADGRAIQSLSSGTREDLPDGIRWLEQNDFTQLARYVRSEMALADFDPAPFTHYLQRSIQNNLQIKPLSDIMPGDPDWQRKLYDLDWILEQDEPHPNPPRQQPFEDYVKETFGVPNFNPESWFIVLDGAHFAGLSVLYFDKAKQHVLHTDWTGVDRPYRKQGLAIAMKLVAIQYAMQRDGITHLHTDNHEDNWMYQINRRLGFKPIPAYLDYVKQLV